MVMRCTLRRRYSFSNTTENVCAEMKQALGGHCGREICNKFYRGGIRSLNRKKNENPSETLRIQGSTSCPVRNSIAGNDVDELQSTRRVGTSLTIVTFRGSPILHPPCSGVAIPIVPPSALDHLILNTVLLLNVPYSFLLPFSVASF
jgi:hypothetical protein